MEYYIQACRLRLWYGILHTGMQVEVMVWNYYIQACRLRLWHVIEHSGMQAEVMVWNITYRHAG
jgi:hypothetical protein